MTAPAVALAIAAPIGPAIILPAMVAIVPHPPGITCPTNLSNPANASVIPFAPLPAASLMAFALACCAAACFASSMVLAV